MQPKVPKNYNISCPKLFTGKTVPIRTDERNLRDKEGQGSVKEVKKELMNLSSKKATTKGDIPAKILKDSLSVYTRELTTIINNCLKDGLFPYELKLADISPVFKKDDDLNKENYRPVSILSHMSKIFERIFYKQIDRFMTSKFSPFLCGFKKNHNS